MHNFFLGSAKHAFGIWLERNILTKECLKLLEERFNLFIVPADVGRLPTRISSCYGSFTASQWKNWITIYSPVLLKDILPPEQLHCWLLFVCSCCIFSFYCVKKSDLTAADLLLLKFCQEFERLYGESSCTFNMHLHLHLKLDFGPLHASWCFSFERYNGILGAYHTNNRAIEPHLMRKFGQNQSVYSLDMASIDECRSMFPP